MNRVITECGTRRPRLVEASDRSPAVGIWPVLLDLGIAEPSSRMSLVAMSRDDNPKATLLLFPREGAHPTSAVKVALTTGAAAALDAEARALTRLAELDPTGVRGTVSRRHEQHPGPPALLVTDALPGRPMLTGYHRFGHTARRRTVAADFAAAAAWLNLLGALVCPTRPPVCYADRVAARWPGDDVAARAADVTRRAQERLGAPTFGCDRVLHGDFWCGNILLTGDRVTGLVDWEHAQFGADPLRDRARFALSYTLYLGRHTPPGRPVRGHPGLVAGRWGEPVRAVLRGTGWYADQVAGFVGEGLRATGRPAAWWRVALIAGLAEIAATSDEDGFARDHAGLVGEFGDIRC